MCHKQLNLRYLKKKIQKTNPITVNYNSKNPLVQKSKPISQVEKKDTGEGTAVAAA